MTTYAHGTNLDSIFCHKPDKVVYFKFHITMTETQHIQSSVGDAGVLLYQHYLRMASVKEPDFSDLHAANYFGWKESKAKRIRIALSKEGYFQSSKTRGSDGYTRREFHVGKRKRINTLTPQDKDIG